MNREIKFKAIRRDGKGWVYGVPYTIYGENKSFMINNAQSLHLTQEDTLFDGFEVLPKTVCKFTGLLDKNGKEIYAKDLTIDKDGNKTVVVWINEWAMFGCMFLDEFDKYTRGGIKELDESMFWTFPIENKSLEVSGNIHEGKEAK